MHPNKQALIEYFNQRTNYDNAGDFHSALANSLVDYANLQPGLKVLDLATGTGLVAIKAAEKVGDGGLVIGCDFSPGMLAQAEQKKARLKLNNLQFQLADVENFSFSPDSFDVIFCCSSLPYLRDIPAALKHFFGFLKPGGALFLSAFSESSFILGHVLREIAVEYEINMPIWNGITGTPALCCALLEDAGYEQIKIKTEQFGHYLTLEQAISGWESILKNPLSAALTALKPMDLQQARQDFCQKLTDLSTKDGIWNEILTFLIVGYKP